MAQRRHLLLDHAQPVDLALQRVELLLQAASGVGGGVWGGAVDGHGRSDWRHGGSLHGLGHGCPQGSVIDTIMGGGSLIFHESARAPKAAGGLR